MPEPSRHNTAKRIRDGSIISSTERKFDNQFRFVRVADLKLFCQFCQFCKSKQKQFHVCNSNKKVLKSATNRSSKFGLIEETMDPSRILLAVLCLE